MLTIIVDGNGKIDVADMRIFFEDQNFQKRKINFSFDNFYSQAFGNTALWSITGYGATREEVERVMQTADLDKHNTRVDSAKITDVYRKNPNKESLAYRLGASNVWVLVWEFDGRGRLVSLSIN